MESSIPPLTPGVFVEFSKCAEDLIKSCENRAYHEAELVADANTPHITNSKQAKETQVASSTTSLPQKSQLDLPFVEERETNHFLGGLDDGDGNDDFGEYCYDSDGEMPNIGFTKEEYAEMERYFEEEIQNEPLHSMDIDEDTVVGDQLILLSEDEIKKLKVAELQAELKKIGLTLHGNKPELLKRIKKAMVDKTTVLVEKDNEVGA